MTTTLGPLAMSLDECDRLIQSAAGRLLSVHGIVCLFTGPLPAFCETMRRDPTPTLGWALNELAVELERARLANAAVEDGALMFGRADVSQAYRAVGWSYRLFPPAAQVSSLANKGSAHNSCLAMSVVAGVDALYQMSQGQVWRFRSGAALSL